MSKVSTAVRSLRRRSGRLAAKILGEPQIRGGGPPSAHFVRDYRRLVKRLIASHPIDEAMSLAVGGNYDEMGAHLAQMMVGFGLHDGMQLLDLGCGSGRLAHAVANRVDIGYLGLDVVPELLAYARTKCPPHYRFEVNESLSLPAPSAAFDMVSVFSVFTHLLHEESFLYLREIERVLRPGGKAVVTFLEFAAPRHWALFEDAMSNAQNNSRSHLDMFIERSVLEVWASKVGLEIVRFDPPAPADVVSQTIAVLIKSARASRDECHETRG